MDVATSAQQPDRIELDLPAGARFASTARAVVAALASDAGFSIDDIEDLRLGVDEAISVVCDRSVDDSRLHLTFERGPRRITAQIALLADGTRQPVDDELSLDPLAERILAAVVDSFSVDGGVFKIVKSTSS